MKAKMKETMAIPTIVLIGCAVVAVWVLMGVFASDRPSPGQFGDMFGAVNALFTGLAFAGLIYTIILQREELGLQRKELRLTRRELNGQKKEFAAQNSTMALQRFESSFFSILRVHHQIIDAMDLNIEAQKQAKSRDCFNYFYRNLRNEFSKRKPQTGKSGEQGDVANIDECYESFYKERQHEVGHYFRNLYHLINFIDKSDVQGGGFDAKKRYTNLVRAQLSSYELTMIFYNCLSKYGREKFKPLVEQYGLLKNMEKSLLVSSEHEACYAKSAFGERSPETT